MKAYWFRALLFTLVVTLISLGLTVLAGTTQTHPEIDIESIESIEYHEIYVEDTLVGYTQDAGWIHDMLDQMILTRAVETGFQVRIQEDIQVVAMVSSDPPDPTPPEILQRDLQDRLNIVTHAVGIEIGGEQVAVVANERDAQEILDKIIANHFDLRASDERTTVHSVEIVEEVKFMLLPADPATIVDPEKVEQILLRGTDRTLLYEVQQGETAWAIAETAGLSVGQLERANPGADISRIFPGDELQLVVADPHITLRSEEERWYIRHVPNRVETRTDDSLWPWERVVLQAGKPGEVRVTVRLLLEGGQEIDREIVSEERISDPVTHIVARGTKTVPQYGTGQFILPASGTLTSGFGWRNRGFHYGIDLAMPIGTPVKAADKGMVTLAGSAGNYGIMIKIDHGNGEYVTVYAHLSRTAVSVGDVVEQGQVIGYSGNTGRSTGPHLHFEIRVNGVPRNPIGFFSD